MNTSNRYFNAILCNFRQLKFALKLTLRKLKKKTYCTHLVLVKMIDLGYLKVVIEW